MSGSVSGSFLLTEHAAHIVLCNLSIEAGCIADRSRLFALTGSVMNNGPEAVRMLGPACF